MRLPQQVPWTGQPRRTTGLERLGFYGDTWAVLRAGLRASLRAGLRTALRVGPQDHATRRAAGPCYTADRRAALRVGPPGRATRRAAGPRYAPGSLAALRAGLRTAPQARPTTAPPRRWAFGPTDGRHRYIPMDIEDPHTWILQPDSCTIRWDSVCWSLLHTAGPDNSGLVIRLHLLGPAAILGSGHKQGRGEQRHGGPTRCGTGGRRRLRRAEPGRIWT